MIAIYCRVSTKKQADQMSLKEQESSGIIFANNCNEDYRIYKDIKSGKNMVDRDDLVALIEDIISGLIQKVWIGDVDRLTRDMEDGGKFKKIIDNNNVTLYDRGRVISSIEYGVRVVIAEEERKKIIERTTRNRREQIDAGWNRYSSIYGYRQKIIGTHKNGRILREWEIDPDEKEMINKIYDWYFQDLNFDQICFELQQAGYKTKRNKTWDRGTIHNILRRPEYIGQTHDSKGNRIPSKVYKEPIVDIEKWERVQSTIDSKIRIRQGKHFRVAAYDCSGLLKCGTCEAKYFFHRGARDGKNREHYYHKQLELKHRKCPQAPKVISRNTIDYLFKALFVITFSDYQKVRDFIKQEQENILKENRNLSNDLNRINANITDLENQRNRLIESRAEGTLLDSEIRDKMQEIRKKIEEQNIFLESARHDMDIKTINLNEIIAGFAEDTVETYLKVDNKKRRELNLKYISSAKVDGYIISVKYITGVSYDVDLRAFLAPVNLLPMMMQLKIADMQGKIDVLCNTLIVGRESPESDSVQKRKNMGLAIRRLESNHFNDISNEEYESMQNEFFIKGKGRPRKSKVKNNSLHDTE